ncbi:hypothetical protein H8M03_00220 [Sphingomonas sabuli]|uniref:DUF2490 domain-containing protein n=1 Tax=Sphingomonas sabuli TaxID=2764186 RepID=A0A7G9L2J0_9SPHN|nr:hypothetical protein [Sphingomonas sabuli]QNM82839.1 hypothetical protein H8M03_00220 [Sphingomonas sabuli]
MSTTILALALAAASPAIGADVFYSSDAEDTEVFKTGINFDLRHESAEKYLGVRVERARFRPLGQDGKTMERAYVRAADSLGDWKWNATVGTDGHTVLGSAAIHDEARFRKEFFVERDIIETPQGLSRGIYYTFAGAAIDLPADDRNILTLFGGVQAFTGDNVRTHLRATYVHVLKPDWGLSAQLRARYFHSSDPGEYDYFSPRWYAEVLPVLQVRRFVSGWQLLGAAGYGAQRNADSDWRSARYFNARVTSPADKRGWALTGNALYTSTPVATGNTYGYFQFNLGLTRAF